MLTDKGVRAAKAKDKAYKLADSRGLHLHVSYAGHKSWRYKYRFDKKERLLTLGSYPTCPWPRRERKGTLQRDFA